MAYFGLCISLTTLQVECSSVCTVQNMAMVSKLPVILRKEQYISYQILKSPSSPKKEKERRNKMVIGNYR